MASSPAQLYFGKWPAKREKIPVGYTELPRPLERICDRTDFSDEALLKAVQPSTINERHEKRCICGRSLGRLRRLASERAEDRLLDTLQDLLNRFRASPLCHARQYRRVQAFRSRWLRQTLTNGRAHTQNLENG